MKFFLWATIIMLALLSAGCQQITQMEFYQPTKQNQAYCVKAHDGTPGRGPIKVIKGKTGAIDWSDGKNISLNISGIAF